MKKKKVSIGREKILQEVKGIMVLVHEFQVTMGFASFDYGCLYETGEWECSFFKNSEDDEPALYFFTPSLKELVSQLQNYGK